MVNGFLVRDDGSMIAVDAIIWIELSPIKTVSPTQYDIWIRMVEGQETRWNSQPLTDTQAAVTIVTLKDMLTRAAEL